MTPFHRFVDLPVHVAGVVPRYAPLGAVHQLSILLGSTIVVPASVGYIDLRHLLLLVNLGPLAVARFQCWQCSDGHDRVTVLPSVIDTGPDSPAPDRGLT